MRTSTDTIRRPARNQAVVAVDSTYARITGIVGRGLFAFGMRPTPAERDLRRPLAGEACADGSIMGQLAVDRRLVHLGRHVEKGLVQTIERLQAELATAIADGDWNKAADTADLIRFMASDVEWLQAWIEEPDLADSICFETTGISVTPLPVFELVDCEEADQLAA